ARQRGLVVEGEGQRVPGVQVVADVVAADPAGEVLGAEPGGEAAVGAPVAGVAGHGRHLPLLVAQQFLGVHVAVLVDDAAVLEGLRHQQGFVVVLWQVLAGVGPVCLGGVCAGGEGLLAVDGDLFVGLAAGGGEGCEGEQGGCECGAGAHGPPKDVWLVEGQHGARGRVVGGLWLSCDVTKPRAGAGLRGVSVGTVVHGDRHTACDLRSSCLAGDAVGVDGGDVGGAEPGVALGAAGAGEAASVDEVPDGAGRRAEDLGDLGGGEVAGRGVHAVRAGHHAASGRLGGAARGPSTPATSQVGALYQGHYRGSGPPLHQVLSAVSSEGVSVAGSVEGAGSTRRADSSSSAGTAASRSARRYPARFTPATLTCLVVRSTPAASSSEASCSASQSP